MTPSTAQILATLGVDPNAPASRMTALELVEAVARAVHGPPPAPEPEWLTTKEAAKLCRVSEKTLRRWATESDVIRVKKGSGRAPDRYSRESLDAHLGGSWTPAPLRRVA